MQQELYQTRSSPTFLPLWTNELFLSKNVYSLLDHQKRLTVQRRALRVSCTIQENKKAPVRLDSLITGHCMGDCSLIQMAPVSVLVFKPIWLSLAPRSLGSGPVLGRLRFMSECRRDFLLGFPMEIKGISQKWDIKRESCWTISSYIPVPVHACTHQEEAHQWRERAF